MAASEARASFSEVVNRVAYGGERVVFERRGKALAVLISAEDLARLEAAEDEADYREARRVERAARAQGERPVPLQEVKRQLRRR